MTGVWFPAFRFLDRSTLLSVVVRSLSPNFEKRISGQASTAIKRASNGRDKQHEVVVCFARGSEARAVIR